MSRFIATLLFLIGAVLVAVFYLAPEWDRFKSLRQEIATLEETSAELDELIKKRDILFDTVNALPREKLSQISQTIPRGSQSSELIVLLETLAAESNVALKNIGLSPPTSSQRALVGQSTPGALQSAVPADNAIHELPLALNVTGSYASLKNFLAALERSVRLIDVIEVNFGSVAEGGLINFSIRAKTYYQ